MCQSHLKFLVSKIEVVFNEKKMNKILQNVFFKNKKRKKREKNALMSWMRCTEEDYY